MRTWKFVVGAAVLAVATPLTAQAAPPSGVDSFVTAPSGTVDAKLVPSSLSKAPVKVIVELSGDPVTVVEAKQRRKLDNAEKKALREQLKQQQKGVADKAKQVGGKVLAEMQDAYNGVKVQVAGTEVNALAQAPGVKAVHAVTVHELDNATSVPYLGVPQVWQDTGFTGKGVKVAIIDTGIDYTHADFAGPGTVAAFEAAKATETQPADPALFGPNAPRIKGGWDFVGNAYDANTAGSVPKPDPNPLDCNSHGTHVAGTAGGGGVTADGAAYTGPYNAATAGQPWKVGPGVAPEVDLYAYKVFGCAGSTDVTTEAIDRAVADGVDVINMSLGSSYGTAEDTSAVAASNAVGAGVVVIASAGNSGPNPYLTGSPGTGRGVVSVAANDSTAQFPGAKVSFADGSSLVAINANGLDPLPAGPFTIVALKDDPATAENESLGCSVAAYTSNGIKAGANQLAVSVRGTCARAARPIYAQQAGAAAAAMIDTSANYPPFEGAIVENPDTGAPFEVTIPFLGFRGVLGSAATDDGDKVVAANGQQVTLAAQPLDNPAFTKFASFSSGGPRTGDSGLKANVTAPGVSTVSAGVGTGNDAAVKSGTSMAAPHVAGVAALNVQAHPNWSAPDVAANLVNTADPGRVGDYRLTLGGAGLVDTAQSVKGQVTVVGDSYRTASGSFGEASLSFGFAEATDRFSGKKNITVTNHGTSPVTLALSNEATPQSRPASVSFSTRSVTVPAGGTAKVDVTVNVEMGSVGSALTGGFAFYEASGNVVLKGGATELRVPWLLVPRAQANVEASLNGNLNPQTHANGSVSVRGNVNVELTNKGGALGTTADFYQLGLVDGQNDVGLSGHPGTDLRALGVQSFDLGSDKLLVFAMNSYDRYSNAARNQSQVIIDRNNDGRPEFIVFAVDSGLVRAASADGRNEVFIYDVAKKTTSAAGYLAVSPTDNSTTLLPVKASSLGITKATGVFAYTGAIESVASSAAYDEFDGVARYNAWAPAIENGQSVDVNKGSKKAKVKVSIDSRAFAAQQPEGIMVAVLDNRSGADEAILLRRR
ncbi:S8 family peptidase [Propioniciclava coleopterorum]|uniref:S8 family peptidase n=1 Tax=Propioniciclava coleopterorum TaxID=2714937 RepID=UPI001981D219|nr:S8 family serine peptidase [Propioniciclava coleopterorum]